MLFLRGFIREKVSHQKIFKPAIIKKPNKNAGSQEEARPATPHFTNNIAEKLYGVGS
jgi:hypothetical protein